LREREREKRAGRGRESQADFALSLDPEVGLDSATPKSGSELKPRVRHFNPLCHPGAPVCIEFLEIISTMS